MDFLFSAATQICHSLQLPKSLQGGLQALGEAVPAEGVFVNIYVEHLQQILFLAHATRDSARAVDMRVDLPDVYVEALRRPDRPAVLRVDRIEHDPVTHWVAPRLVPEIASFVMVRMNLEGKHLGVAAFYSRRPGAFSEQHAEWLAQLHDPLALVTANALLPRLADRNRHLRHENASLQARLRALGSEPDDSLVGSSQAFSQVRRQIDQVAPFDVTVLIQGETGTGKEVVANAIHRRSNRAARPFVKVNCGAIPETLLDSELFGHERGAFTDAHQARRGYFEQADGSTLFLDEIGELSAAGQVRLLRALQTKTINRVGSTAPIKLDVRVIAATHRNLEAMVESGAFREDLWYRLNVVPIEVPALRDRPDDILALADRILEGLRERHQLPRRPELDARSRAQALRHGWPGNVRELENALERALLRSPDPQALQLELPESAPAVSAPQIAAPPEGLSYDEMARRYFEALLADCGGRIFGPGGAAERADLHPNTLRSRLKKLGIDPAAARQRYGECAG